MRVHRGLDHSRARADRRRFRRTRGQGRLAGQSRLRRGDDRLRLRAAGRRRKRRHDHHVHTGGSSIPGSGAITGDHLLKMHPHVSFHINGGPTAMPDRDFERVIRESRWRCRSAPRVTCAPRCFAAACCARSTPSTASHRDRHADRQRHHAARHALHHRAPLDLGGLASNIILLCSLLVHFAYCSRKVIYAGTGYFYSYKINLFF